MIEAESWRRLLSDNSVTRGRGRMPRQEWLSYNEENCLKSDFSR